MTHPDINQTSAFHRVLYLCACVCVSSTGQVTGLQRGPTTEKWEYDSQGRIISRVFADGKMWSYTYLDKVQDDISKASILADITNFCMINIQLRTLCMTAFYVCIYNHYRITLDVYVSFHGGQEKKSNQHLASYSRRTNYHTYSHKHFQTRRGL